MATALGARLLRSRRGAFLPLWLRLDMLVLAQLFSSANLSLRLALSRNTFGLAIVVRMAAGTITRRRTNLEFVELVPFRIGAIPVGDGQQLADSPPRIDSLWIVHASYYEPLATHDSTVVAQSNPPAKAKNRIRTSGHRRRPI